MAVEQKKPLTIVCGDPHAGMIRVMDTNGVEIPNIISVDINLITPGEIPVVNIKLRAPELVIKNFEPLEEVEMTTKTISTSASTPNTARKKSSK